MKSVLKKLEITREKIVNQCEKRDAYFMSKSEEWQESKRGKAYNTKTAVLANSIDGIDNAITEVKSFLH